MIKWWLPKKLIGQMFDYKKMSAEGYVNALTDFEVGSCKMIQWAHGLLHIPRMAHVTWPFKTNHVTSFSTWSSIPFILFKTQ